MIDDRIKGNKGIKKKEKEYNNNNKNHKSKGKAKRDGGSEKSMRERFYFLFFFSSFYLDIWKSDRRFSSGLKAKLIHAARATHGVPKSWSFVKLHGVGNFPTWLISILKVI